MPDLQPLNALCNSIREITKNPIGPNDPILACDCTSPAIIKPFLQSIPEAFALANEKLHVYPFSDVEACWLRLYTDASLGRAMRVVERKILRDFEFGRTGEEGKLRSKVKGTAESAKDPVLALAGLDEVVRILDMALIMAGGLGREEMIHELMGELKIVAAAYDGDYCLGTLPPGGDGNGEGEVGDENDGERASKRRKIDQSGHHHQPRLPNCPNDIFLKNRLKVPMIAHPIPSLHNPSLLTFQSHLTNTKTPLILKGIMTHWPALQQWKKPSFWLDQTIGGRRLVPVELGGVYTDDDWGQRVMPFAEFLRDYLLAGEEGGGEGEAKEEGTKNGEKGEEEEEGEVDHQKRITTASTSKVKEQEKRVTGYLAQHDLFRQIPSLRSSIAVPDYCYLEAPGPDPGTAVYESLLRKKNEKECKKQKRTAMSNGNEQPETDKDQSVEPSGATDDATDPNNNDASNDIQTHLFLGPAYTISPLHHDPHHNILCQVMGSKYIRLYSADKSMYPLLLSTVPPKSPPSSSSSSASPLNNPTDSKSTSTSTSSPDKSPNPSAPSSPSPQSPPPPTNPARVIDQSNTSTLPLHEIETSPHEDWDSLYPEFSELKYTECILREGEALYIPVGWWHYVRSLGVAGSVSFWF